MGAADEESSKQSAPEPMMSPPKQSSGSGSSTEFEPPLACVRRMLKNTLPNYTNVGKDACSAFSRCCGIFIVYLTACANDFARESKRQTITANDIIAACKELDFEEFAPKLEKFIEEHRKNEKKKKALKKSEDEAKASAKHLRDDDQSEEDESESPIKKRKKSTDDAAGDEDGLEIEDGAIDNDNDAEESIADVSQDEGESQVLDQDDNDSNDDKSQTE